MALWSETSDDVAYFYSATGIKYGTMTVIGTMQANEIGESDTPSSGGEHSYTF